MPSRAVPTETCSLDQTIDDMSTVEVGRQEISADFAATDMLGELATVVQHPGLTIPELTADNKIPAIKELVDRLHEHDVVARTTEGVFG